MIITRNGLTIRFSVDDIRQMGRAAQGVRAIHLREGDAIASVAKIARDEEMEGEENAENTENAQADENGTPIDTSSTDNSVNENE